MIKPVTVPSVPLVLGMSPEAKKPVERATSRPIGMQILKYSSIVGVPLAAIGLISTLKEGKGRSETDPGVPLNVVDLTSTLKDERVPLETGMPIGKIVLAAFVLGGVGMLCIPKVREACVQRVRRTVLICLIKAKIIRVDDEVVDPGIQERLNFIGRVLPALVKADDIDEDRAEKARYSIGRSFDAGDGWRILHEIATEKPSALRTIALIYPEVGVAINAGATGFDFMQDQARTLSESARTSSENDKDESPIDAERAFIATPEARARIAPFDSILSHLETSGSIEEFTARRARYNIAQSQDSIATGRSELMRIANGKPTALTAMAAVDRLMSTAMSQAADDAGTDAQARRLNVQSERTFAASQAGLRYLRTFGQESRI